MQREVGEKRGEIMVMEADHVAQPNILLIMSDQHRYDWLGVAQPGTVETPNLDRLAARGVRLRQTYCTSPLCAPSRASLATGLYPHRTGVLANPYNLPPRHPTYYQRLRDAGYRVGLVGKLDLNKPELTETPWGDPPLMYRLGFTDPLECEGKMNIRKRLEGNRGPYAAYLAEKGWLQPLVEDYLHRMQELPVYHAADSVLPTAGFEDDFIGRRAAGLLARLTARPHPWHLCVHFVGPHDPWDPPTEYADLFRQAAMPEAVPDPMDGKPRWQRQRQQRHAGASRAQVNLVRRQYTAMVKLIDDQVGRLVEQLEASGQLERTVIVYTSDHGEMLGDHGLYQKSVFYQPSVRVPLIAAGPGLASGITSDALVEHHDLAPTFMELAGAHAPGDLDAQSLVPVLTGRRSAHRNSVMSQLQNGHMIADGRYTYVENVNDANELYDRQNDPDELHNRVGDAADARSRLRDHLRQRRIGATGRCI